MLLSEIAVPEIDRKAILHKGSIIPEGWSMDADRRRGVILRGNRARKLHSYAINPIGTVNMPPLGHICGGQIIVDMIASKRRSLSELILAADRDPNVVLVKANPAMTPDMLSRCLGTASAAVIEARELVTSRRNCKPP